MTAQYTDQQILFSLNSIANAPSGRHGTVAELESYGTEVLNCVFADPGIIALIGEWQLVWGVSVFQAENSDVADNAMYVAQNKSNPSEFVVAISGTNPISAYGWIVEDLTINPPVAWPYGNAGATAGQITQGTNVGLNNLLNVLQSNGQTLLPFLAGEVSQSNSPLSITVTGHSLGGALSPVTALALKDTQGISAGQPNSWDPDSTASISVLPSAGPTPGNVTWRDYYDESLGGTTDRIWNAIDIVPHAWQVSMLEAIPTLYEPTIPATIAIRTLVKFAIINSKLAGDLEQILPDVQGLPGIVDPDVTLSVADLRVMLETLIANKLIDKLGKDLPANVLALMTAIVDELLKYLNEQPDPTAKVGLQDALDGASGKSLTSLNSLDADHKGSIINLLNFLIQAAHQHTVAYPELLGTMAFYDMVNAIEARLG